MRLNYPRLCVYQISSKKKKKKKRIIAKGLIAFKNHYKNIKMPRLERQKLLSRKKAMKFKKNLDLSQI